MVRCHLKHSLFSVCMKYDISLIGTQRVISHVARYKRAKNAGGRSGVCPNFVCSFLLTGICTLILWIMLHRKSMPPNGDITPGAQKYPKVNKSLSIFEFYLLTPGCRTSTHTLPKKHILHLCKGSCCFNAQSIYQVISMWKMYSIAIFCITVND